MRFGVRPNWQWKDVYNGQRPRLIMGWRFGMEQPKRALLRRGCSLSVANGLRLSLIPCLLGPQCGVIPRVTHEIFRQIHDTADSDSIERELTVEFVEVYGEVRQP